MSGENSGSAQVEKPDYDSFPIVIKLEYPIEKGTGDKAQTFEELSIARRLQARDLSGIQVQGMTFDDTVKIISRLTALPRNIVERLDGKDMLKFTDIVNYFLGLGQ